MRRTQFRSLEIDSFETDTYHLPLHSHTYYEMIYIFKGRGAHHINQGILDYKEGDLFLISPGDLHYFVVQERTDFMFIKFNDSFFEIGDRFSTNSHLSSSPIHLMSKAQFKEIKLTIAQPYQDILHKIAASIRAYDDVHDVSKSSMIYFLVFSIFELIRENTLLPQLKLAEITSKASEIISYIHQNIYQPERLKIKEIAATFTLSPNYFSTYFKRNFKLPYHNYIEQYKLQLIEKRLIDNTQSIKSIAHEFGFTDLSHLNAFFKRNKNSTPSAFRTQEQQKN